MAETQVQTQPTVYGDSHTKSERNAFPVGATIFSAIISLVVIRWLFGLVPLSYTLDLQTIEFYYRGKVVSMAPPDGYCYTGQSDIVERGVQIWENLRRIGTPNSGKFVSFRSFRPCRHFLLEEGKVHGYGRYLSLHDLMDLARLTATPSEIGIAGLGAELLPLDEQGRQLYLDSDGLAHFLHPQNFSARLLVYFPQFEVIFLPHSKKYDRSFRTIRQAQMPVKHGVCVTAEAQLIHSPLPSSIRRYCETEQPDDDECESRLFKQYSQPLRAFHEGRKDNFQSFPYSEQLSIIANVYLAMYVTTFEGRSVFFGFAKNPTQNAVHSAQDDLRLWAQKVCDEADQVSTALSWEKAQRGALGASWGSSGGSVDLD
jgi:hypothetical protein